MKNINEVLHKLAETRLPCPTFIMDELERLYYESDENGMANALLEADLLATKKELAERDRTLARISADLDTSVSSQLNMTDKAYRYQKALEEAKTAIQKDLALANGKDEQALLSAFNHINKALGE
ncbi:hypothetical protein [Paenibacillus polymyxa]|uniref:hypothetical protein n=1 Tax=Paenibacillus polymyxa TaxID=1406 RepID=UPI00129B1C45|nr:hypothetical protein [Paenibacillus polymyxa]KAE8558966.1 hypothetical protein BJH92_16915 [Paenibacillus polymyxa]